MNFAISPNTHISKLTIHRMIFQTSRTLLVFVFLIASAFFSGCAVTTQKQLISKPIEPKHININKPVGQIDKVKKGWWQVGFHRDYENGDEVQWQYDTYAALKIIKPVIDNVSDIDPWRFHRRAIQDNSGHKFSFIFYATRKVGEKVYKEIATHPAVKQLLANGHITRLSFYDINKELREDIKSRSDDNWPVELQETWPYFIMGASQTWLGLVERYYNEMEVDADAGLEEQLEAFEQVNIELNKLWKYNGSHAFLHHLNALFAYQELYILERRLGNF